MPVVVSSVPPRPALARGVDGGHQVGAVVEGDLRLGRRPALHVGHVVLDALAAGGATSTPLAVERLHHVVLGGERVGRRHLDVGPAARQRPGQDAGLGGDVQAGRHPHAVERPLRRRSARRWSGGPACGPPPMRCVSVPGASSSGSDLTCTGPRRDADVGRLVGGQLGQLHVESVEVQPGHALVEVLGQHVHAELVLVGLAVQLDLSQHLVGERVRHHEARVARGVAQVEQPALREQDDRVAVRELPLVDLRLDVDLLDAVGVGQAERRRSRCRSGRCCPRWPGASSGSCGRP